VCTAGRCRSPIAAALLEQRVSHVHRHGLSVGSVGLKFAGAPVPDLGIEIMAERGIDLTDHRSEPVTMNTIAASDLILGMTREHVREIVDIEPSAWAKTFTLKDFIRRADQLGPMSRHQRFDDWLGAVGEGRDPRNVLGTHPDDEVPDPFGQRARAWQKVVGELDALVSKLPRILGVSSQAASRTA